MDYNSGTNVTKASSRGGKSRKKKSASKIIQSLIKKRKRTAWARAHGVVPEDSPIGYSQKKKSISDYVTFMIRQYEGADILMDVSSELLKGSESFFVKSPHVKKSLSFLKRAIPISIGAYDFYKKSELFFKDGMHDSMRNKYLRKMSNYLGIEEISSICEYPLGLSKDVFLWLMSNPETKFFNIERTFDFNENKDVEYTDSEEGGKIFLKFKWKAKTYIWGINYRNTMLGPQVTDARIYSNAIDDTIAHDLNQDIMRDYVKSFDIKRNSIILYPDTIETRPRCTKLHEINQFDIKKFKDEIKKILALKKKRAYAFVGLPGTGKTSIIMRLEKELTDVPFIYISSRCVNYEGAITHMFNMIRTLQPCVVVFEDLDSFDFGNKDSKLGVFLNEIDDVRGYLQAVFLATINDTNRVHYSLINRPGRFDKVILVKPPQYDEEVYSVMTTRFEREVNKFYSDRNKKIVTKADVSKNFFSGVIENNLTQVDICEIIDSALLHHDLLESGVLIESLNSILLTKQNIKLCNFKNRYPDQGYDGPMNDEGCSDPIEATCNKVRRIDVNFIKE
jgi:hypothetical protein